MHSGICASRTHWRCAFGEATGREPSWAADAAGQRGWDYLCLERHVQPRRWPPDRGKLRGGVVECPFHGGRFEVRSGKAVMLPATEDIATFAVRIEEILFR